MKTEFDTSKYEMSHSRKPRGMGSWAFCPADKYDRDDYLDFVTWRVGYYSAVRKLADAEFRFLGISRVVVGP